jgi:hypothetical protein
MQRVLELYKCLTLRQIVHFQESFYTYFRLNAMGFKVHLNR